MTIVCIIQARMGSLRFPGKVMEDLAGKPVIEHVVERCRKIDLVDRVVLAVAAEEDQTLIDFVQEKEFDWAAGSVKDVLARYSAVAAACDAKIVMRITGDCPLIDPAVCAMVLSTLIKNGIDYASNIEPRKFPQGLDCEAFTIEALQAADILATTPYDREHVTSYMRRLEARMDRRSVPGPDLADRRWVLDWPEDLEFMRALYNRGEPTNLSSTLAILSAHPQIEKINARRAFG